MQLLIFWDSGAPAGIELPVTRMMEDCLDLSVGVRLNPIVMNGYVGSRRQTDACTLLDSISIYRERADIGIPVLVVCGSDLFTGECTSVFGLARPSAGSAVVSTARLDNRFYGRMENDDDLIDRTVKEGAHEVGHLFSLDHCTDPGCIMFNPLTLDDLDRKRKAFCPSCRDRLRQARTHGPAVPD